MRFSLLLAFFSPRAWRLAVWGALGGALAYLLGEPLSRLFGSDGGGDSDALVQILSTGVWTALVGAGMGAVILVGDNLLSLRGRWNRDLPLGTICFAILGAVSGALAQAFYDPALRQAGVTGPLNPLNPADLVLRLGVGSLVRGVAWAVLGAGLGIGLGLLRRDWKSALRGGLGGVIGGFQGGSVFDFVTVALVLQFGMSGSRASSLSRFVGLVITGACIAWCIRVAQEALRTAWLIGVSTGPYEGKECLLNKARLSVGRSEANDIALWRDESVPVHLGDFVFQGGAWWWEGQPALIDGVAQVKAPLRPDSIIELGSYRFKFFDRSRNRPRATASVPLPPYVAKSPDPASASPLTGDSAVCGPRLSTSMPLGTGSSPGGATSPPRVAPRGGPPLSPPPASAPSPTTAPANQTPVVATTPAAIPGHLLVITPLDALYRSFSLAMSRATVGRAAANDWTLADSTVSGQHALLTVEGSTLFVRDLDSTNGTFVNGQKLAPNVPTPLHEGFRVKFGQVECLVGRK